MDRSSGDGADSADDSGSSQPYPSTLPGIPKVQHFFSFLLPWCLLFPPIFVILNEPAKHHSGKCQATVSAFAGANGRGYP